MKMIEDLRILNKDQRAAFVASLLGWTLDAFDFFIMVFAVNAIAKDFHKEISTVTMATMLTLVCRPIGALVFGRLADRYGRRPILMLNVLTFSVFELASAFAPTLISLFILRALFGFAMGGEWGIGSALVMETIPARCRGTISGILQEGYPLGNLLAGLAFFCFFDLVGWRGMFIIGALPALLVFYIRYTVKESPVWETGKVAARQQNLISSLVQHWRIFLYVVLLMTAFTFLSHGTHDLYPTFLQKQHGFSMQTTATINMMGNIGAIIGGIAFGTWSQTIGRRKAIIISTLFIVPFIPLWSYGSTPLLLAIGGFFLQIGVQGAWGVIPAHLNELSPGEMRGTFPGLAYQLGNLFSASVTVIQAWLAESHGGNYPLAFALTTGLTVVAVILLTAVGREKREIDFGKTSSLPSE